MQPIPQNVQMGIPQQQNGMQIIINLPPSGFQQSHPYYPNNQIPPHVQPGTEFPQTYQPVPVSDPNRTSGTVYPLKNDQATPGEDDQPEQNLPSSYYQDNKTTKKEPAFHPWESRSSTEGCCKMDEEKTKKLCSSIIIIFILINLAIIIALLVYHYGNKDVTLTSMAGALSYIGFNLQAHPILDVIVKDDGTSCPSGYQSTLFGTWPGTNAGCYCANGLKSGKCNKSGKDRTDRLCDDVPARSSIDMFNWGGSKWCVLRAKLGTEYTKTVECASGFRECSPGICVLSTLSCPVTKVKIDSSGTYKLATGTNRYIVPETVSGDTPLIALSITPNDIPCFDEERFAAGPVKPYKLLKSNEKGCSKYGSDDLYSFQLDDQKQEDLFDENDFPSRVMNLPEYDEVYEDTDSVLSYRRRMDVAENDYCLSINTALIDESGEAADKLNNFMTGTSITVAIVHGLFFLALCIIPCVAKCAGRSYSDLMEGSSSKIWLIPASILGFMEFVVLIVMLASVRKYRGVMVESKDYFVELAEMNCFVGGQAQEVITDYQVAVDEVAGNLYKYSLALFLLSIFLSVLPCLFLWIKYRSSSKY